MSSSIADRTLPMLYPHVFGFPLQMAILLHPVFPIRPWNGLQIRYRWSTCSGVGWRFSGSTGDYHGLRYWRRYARMLGFQGALHHPQLMLGQCMGRLPVPVPARWLGRTGENEIANLGEDAVLLEKVRLRAGEGFLFVLFYSGYLLRKRGNE